MENQTLESDDVLSSDEAGEFLRLKPGTLARWRSSKTVQIPFIKLGSRVVYLRSSLLEYLKAQQQS